MRHGDLGSIPSQANFFFSFSPFLGTLFVLHVLHYSTTYARCRSAHITVAVDIIHNHELESLRCDWIDVD